VDGERYLLSSGLLKFFPVPRTMGLFVVLVTALAFLAGWIRNELALTLLGTVFLCILAYCFLAVFILGVFHRKKALSLSLLIVCDTVNAGTEGELLIRISGGRLPGKHYFWRLPAVLVRCELCLETMDGRVIRHYADPGVDNSSVFPVRERGAYYGMRDRLVIFDAAGFFRLSLPTVLSSADFRQAGKDSSKPASPRLLAVPHPIEELIPLPLKSGGAERHNETHYRKSDDLTDHRPYVPGDDPRRINWKLYGHAPLGEIFVRDGESEPPPHSRLLILIDTEADSSLYTSGEGRRAVDLLCETALAAALDFSLKGMDIKIGWTGGQSIGGQSTGGWGTSGQSTGGSLNAAELAAALAWPAAIPWPVYRQPINQPPDFKAPALEEMAVIILALPRVSSDASALERFIKNRGKNCKTDIVFVYDTEQITGILRAAKLQDAARVCVNLYNGRNGVYASGAEVSAAHKIDAKDRT